jgi:TPR repeat protein
MLLADKIRVKLLNLLGYHTDSMIGECFYNGRYVGVNKELAYEFFYSAAKKGDPSSLHFRAHACEIKHEWDEAIRIYNFLIENNYPDYMYHMGQLWSHDQDSYTATELSDVRNVEKELHWYYRGAKANSLICLNGLIELSYSHPQAGMYLIDICERGNFKDQDVLETLEHYFKSAFDACGNDNKFISQKRDLAFRLGSFYENGNKSNNIKANLLTCLDYYKIAAELNHSDIDKKLNSLEAKIDRALMKMKHEKLKNNATTIVMKFGKLLKSKYGIDRSFDWYKRFFIVSTECLQQLEIIAKQSPRHSHMLADLYFKYSEPPYQFNRIKTYYYLAVAARGNDDLAFAKLNDFALSGSVEAQIYIATCLKPENPKFLEGCIWLMKLAEQSDHAEAKRILESYKFNINSKHILFSIAQIYEMGLHDFEENIEAAYDYYRSAFYYNDKDAAFRLGELAEEGVSLGYEAITGPGPGPADNIEACQCYIIAGRNGHPTAHLSVERLGDEVDSNTQLEIGDMFRDSPYNNPIKAKKWYEKASEYDSNIFAKSRLVTLKKKPPSSGYGFFFEKTDKDSSNLLTREFRTSQDKKIKVASLSRKQKLRNLG